MIKSIQLTTLELQVIQLALLQLRVATKEAMEKDGNKQSDQLTYNLIAKTELSVLEQS